MENITTQEQTSTINIREYRKKLGLSAERFARMIGSNTCSVYNWEKGRTRPKYPVIWKRVFKLCELFKKIEENPDYLIE